MTIPRRERATSPGGPRLHIAMLAPPWIPIPPHGYGGIESVVALLCDALVEHGHDVELFCAPGSESRAKVHPLLPSSHPGHIERALIEADYVGRAFDAFDAAAETGDPFDVVHENCGYVPLAMLNRLATPLVHTVHGPFDEHTGPYYATHGRKGHVVCISRAQRATAPPGTKVDDVVYNPIDVDAWPVGYRKQDYLLWVGRFTEEKGPQRAIRVAKKVNRPLILAGPVQPGHEPFFATEIEPHVDGKQITYAGEVADARKQQLFADAFAFVLPITWPEPFGMVMVEALAAGTPVLVFNDGAAPEIVQNGVNGFLVEDEEEMTAMVERASEVDPMACRRSAERFAPDAIAARYARVYREAAGARASAYR
jgi:glycosyltransferase involved in cell wall biosynthesis